MKFGIIVGTRPEIIKMSPVIKECARRRLCFFILHTNQHYSSKLDRVFFRELGLSRPHYNLHVGSGTHARATARMLVGIEDVLMKEGPDIVLVQGDTNTALAGSLTASKLHIKIGHIEAGLRSYNRSMPEEINRIVIDHLSDYLFAPTKKAADILRKEGIARSKIYITGNTIVDAVYKYSNSAQKKSKIFRRLRLRKEAYFLITVHRPENVENKKKLEDILKAFELLFEKFKIPLIFPIHPRTKRQLKRFELPVPPGVIMVEPLGFFDFLKLEKNAKLILTDSGGVQEEGCILGVPCVTLRDDTERPETLMVGSNMLGGTNPQKILKTSEYMAAKPRHWRNPFGNGTSAKRIIQFLL